ncbi:MAG: SURF1 family protein [Gammaproteobacteria bacterium]|nr:SURF1 family protein [Gammaproteobacteria bacterium]MDD9894304.1 SURF1 family protein [Gammaproteobacteria bacterium]MDD9958135.1 SURF1 family protein [Gammaproteobacteria bacterium]
MDLSKTYQLGSFEIRINWHIAGCVAITAITFANLGLWQLDRAAEKIEAQQVLEAELRENAGAIEDIPAGHLHPANPEMRNRHVQLRGEYVNERTILVLAEFFDDQIGYGVVTPFRLASNDALVLVHRGWTTGMLPPDVAPVLRPVEGPVEVSAQVFVPPANARIFPSQINAAEWPLRVRSLEIDVISDILDEPIFPFEVRITADQPGTLVRHWPAVNPDVNQNLSYAIQWFSFGLLIVFIALLASSNLWSLMRGPERL